MTEPKRSPLRDPFSQPDRLDEIADGEPVELTTFVAPRRRTPITSPVSLREQYERDTDYADVAKPRAVGGFDDDDEIRHRAVRAPR